MSDEPFAIDKGWDALPSYGDKSGDADDAVTLSISTAPGEWLVNTADAVVVPMSMIEVVEALRAHKLSERSLVWRAGMQEWAPVEKVPQLKLAARMPSVMPPASSAPPRPTLTSKPPPKPVRAAATPAPAPTAALPSRRATLPFGLPSPTTAGQSKPLHPKPTPRPAVAPLPSAEDTEVLAVYARPAATISFDLSPEVPLRSLSAPAATPPQTLAPTTTDSTPRRAVTLPPQRGADLSVVAASQFRQAQQFSKRLILVSSLGSAAVASLLTLWLSHHEPARPAVATTPPAQPATATPAKPAPPPVVEPPAPAPVAVTEPPPAEPSAKPKPKYRVRAKAWRPARPKEADAATTTATPQTADPSSEANPYDVQLEEDVSAKAKPPSASHGSGLEPESAPREETATTAPASPGF